VAIYGSTALVSSSQKNSDTGAAHALVSV